MRASGRRPILHPVPVNVDTIVEEARSSYEAWNFSTRLLGATGREYRVTRRIIEVPVGRVLSYPWNQWRLERLLSVEDLASLLKRNPPDLVGYELVTGDVIYVPTDGNHRVEVSKARGFKTIPALVRAVFKTIDLDVVYYKSNLWDARTGRWILEVPRGMLNIAKRILELRGATVTVVEQ